MRIVFLAWPGVAHSNCPDPGGAEACGATPPLRDINIVSDVCQVREQLWSRYQQPSLPPSGWWVQSRGSMFVVLCQCLCAACWRPLAYLFLLVGITKVNVHINVVACCCNPGSSRHLTVLMTSSRRLMMTPLHLLLTLLSCMMVMAGPQPAYDPVLSLLQKYPAYSSYFISRWVKLYITMCPMCPPSLCRNMWHVQ